MPEAAGIGREESPAGRRGSRHASLHKPGCKPGEPPEQMGLQPVQVGLQAGHRCDHFQASCRKSFSKNFQDSAGCPSSCTDRVELQHLVSLENPLSDH